MHLLKKISTKLNTFLFIFIYLSLTLSVHKFSHYTPALVEPPVPGHDVVQHEAAGAGRGAVPAEEGAALEHPVIGPVPR